MLEGAESGGCNSDKLSDFEFARLTALESGMLVTYNGELFAITVTIRLFGACYFEAFLEGSGNRVYSCLYSAGSELNQLDNVRRLFPMPSLSELKAFLNGYDRADSFQYLRRMFLSRN